MENIDKYDQKEVINLNGKKKKKKSKRKSIKKEKKKRKSSIKNIVTMYSEKGIIFFTGKQPLNRKLSYRSSYIREEI